MVGTRKPCQLLSVLFPYRLNIFRLFIPIPISWKCGRSVVINSGLVCVCLSGICISSAGHVWSPAVWEGWSTKKQENKLQPTFAITVYPYRRFPFFRRCCENWYYSSAKYHSCPHGYMSIMVSPLRTGHMDTKKRHKGCTKECRCDEPAIGSIWMSLAVVVVFPRPP